MSEKKELPVFEIHENDGKTYKIFADGRTEGFGNDPMIVNRIPVRTTSTTDRPTRKLAEITGRKV